MSNLLCRLLDLYVLCVFARIILSWFPVSPGGIMAQLFGFLYTITEPVLGPIRRAIPPIGGFGLDLSPLVVIFGARILGNVFLGC